MTYILNSERLGHAIVHYVRDELKADVNNKNIFINWNVDHEGVVTVSVRIEEKVQAA